MDFNIDSKIEMNKQRLKSDYDNLRNLQNSYGYFVIYLSFIGLTFFDFVQHIKKIDFSNLNNWNYAFLIILGISLIFICHTIQLFLRLFIPKEVAHDRIPQFVYETMYNKVSIWAKKNNKDPMEETRLAYLELLEKAVKNNFRLYHHKRNLIYKTIKYALISLIPYFILMILFNLLN